MYMGVTCHFYPVEYSYYSMTQRYFSFKTAARSVLLKEKVQDTRPHQLSWGPLPVMQWQPENDTRDQVARPSSFDGQTLLCV